MGLYDRATGDAVPFNEWAKPGRDLLVELTLELDWGNVRGRTLFMTLKDPLSLQPLLME